MKVCGLTRVLVPAALTGMAVSTVSGRDLLGVAAAAVVGLVLWLAGRRGGAGASCGLAAPGAERDATAPVVEPLARLDGQLKTVSTKRSKPS